jgi:hypothetical protein
MAKIEKLCDCGCGRLVRRSPADVKGHFYFSPSCYNKVKNDHFSYEEMLLLSPALRGIRESRERLLPSGQAER